jgi:hypothetical protein
MNSSGKVERKITRREFVKETTFGGAAVLAIGAGGVVLPMSVKANQRISKRKQKMRESQYAKYCLTEPELRNKPKIEMSNPSAYIDSARHFGTQTNLSMAWRYIKEPMLFDRIPHTHPFDEYLCFLGGNLEDIFDFDATIELSMGEEQEVCEIEQATVVYIPAGLVHTPLTFKRIDKPVLFHPIALTPSYYSKFTESVNFINGKKDNSD